MTWTLCSVRDPVKALMEMKRVLKPGGALLFAEHGFSCEARIQGWQQQLTPAWRKIAGGCHLDRQIDKLIRASGFNITELQTGYANGLRPLSYIYSGEAQPASNIKGSA
jgi:ubiquinone/menaquinone biosynthesis C-methylase UbiE